MTSAPVYNGLITLQSDGTPLPELATEWEVSPDYKMFTFKLREGVKWHDGTPFTSADVKFTVEEMLSKIQPMAKAGYTQLESVETPDDLTVIIRFTSSNFPYLGVPHAYGPIVPKHLWEGTDFALNPYNKAPVGTGPFKLVEYRIGESFRYEKNPDYFMEGQPAFDELIYRIMPDAVSRSAAFEAGEIDTVSGNAIPYTDIPRLEALPGVKSVAGSPYTGAAWMAIINMDEANGPYANKLVRKALLHAIDRGFIRDNVLPGISTNMIGPIWHNMPLHNAALADYELSAEKANALLDEAGYPRGADGTRFELRLLWSNVFAVVGRMADVMTQNLAAVGIKVVQSPMEQQGLIQKGYLDGEFDIIIGSYGLGPDPDYGTERLYNSNNIRPAPFTNNAHFRNEEVDRLFAEQRLAPTFEARKELYDRIQEIIWDELPAFSMCQYVIKMLYRSDYVEDVFQTWNPLGEPYATAKPVA